MNVADSGEGRVPQDLASMTNRCSKAPAVSLIGQHPELDDGIGAWVAGSDHEFTARGWLQQGDHKASLAGVHAEDKTRLTAHHSPEGQRRMGIGPDRPWYGRSPKS